MTSTGLAALIDENTKALFCESIGNPAGNIVDIREVGGYRPRRTVCR